MFVWGVGEEGERRGELTAQHTHCHSLRSGMTTSSLSISISMSDASFLSSYSYL